MGISHRLRAIRHKCRMLLHKKYKRKLFSRMDENDIKGLEHFYALTSQEVCKKLLSATKSRTLASRLTIEVYSILWDKRGALKEVASPRRYLFDIVARVLLRYLGNPAGHEALLQRYAGCEGRCIIRSDSVALPPKQLDAFVNMALLQLPPLTRQVLNLYYYQYFSIAEIAVQLHRSEAKITSELLTGVQWVEAYVQAQL